MAEQLVAETAAAEPVAARVAGGAVLLVRTVTPGVDQDALPPDHHRLLAIVRNAGGPVATK